MTVTLAAIDRPAVAAYVGDVLLVYSILIVVYVLALMVFSIGGRMPYSNWSDGVLGFLHDVCDPYLRIFRRFIPMVGPFDLSPIVAILALNFIGMGLIVPLIHG